MFLHSEDGAVLRDFFKKKPTRLFYKIVGGKTGDVHGGLLLPLVFFCLVFGLMFLS